MGLAESNKTHITTITTLTIIIHRPGYQTLVILPPTHIMTYVAMVVYYCQISNISRSLVGNTVDHSDVVGASPVGAAPTTSSFSTQHLASMDWAKTTARLDEKHWRCGIRCALYWRLDGSEIGTQFRMVYCMSHKLCTWYLLCVVLFMLSVMDWCT